MGDGIRKGFTGVWYEMIYFPKKGQSGKREGREYRTLEGVFKGAYKSLRTHKSIGEIMIREEDYVVNREDAILGSSSPYAKVFSADSPNYLYIVYPLREGMTGRYKLYADGHVEYDRKIPYKPFSFYGKGSA